MYDKLLLKSFHFGFGGRRSFISALARLKIISDGEGDTSAVVALAFVDKDSERVHCPAVVRGIEYICSRQLDSQRPVKECLHLTGGNRRRSEEDIFRQKYFHNREKRGDCAP